MMTKNIVNKWFNTRFGGSLLLRDGWYGRQYDNQHMLTSIDETGEDISITLDNRLTLHFKGLQGVNPTDRELIPGPFKKLLFEWEGVGDGRRLTKEYDSGEVKIVSAPG
jgi:hypothetical protein